MTKTSLVICHNAVGSIQAKNSEQARALAQCLGELEAEMQAQEASNVVVMEPKDGGAPGPTPVARRRGSNRRGAVDQPIPPAPEGSTAEN